MSKAKLNGEARVQAYLIGTRLRVERFTENEKRQDRTPDFCVFAGDEVAFYCEVKTAQEDERLDQQLAKVLPGGSRNDSTYNRVSGHIHSAVGQFDAVNPAMERPSVLAIVTPFAR